MALQGMVIVIVIDLIFTNSDCISDAGIMDLNFSDHQGILVTRKKQKQEKTNIEFKGRLYKHYDRNVFQENLRKIDWPELFGIDDLSDCWEFMFNKIIKC